MLCGNGALCLALKDIMSASLDVVIQCLQSFVGLLERWRHQDVGRYQHAPDEAVCPNVREEIQGVCQNEGEEIHSPPAMRAKPVEEEIHSLLAMRAKLPMVHPVRAQQPEQQNMWYAVAIGRRPGIYRSWYEASKQVTGYSGNKLKAFTNLEEAELFFLLHCRNSQ